MKLQIKFTKFVFFVLQTHTILVCSQARLIDAPDPEETIGLLFPFESETRDVRSLDGLWRFYKSNITEPMKGVEEKWYKEDLEQIKPTIPMPVPSSYNDLTTEQQLRDHIGTVWYQRKFYVPRLWAYEHRVWLRFGSVHYAAIVWLNGEEIMRHSIGHLPFETEITHYIKYSTENRLTVLCDNTLLNNTIPQGKVEEETSDNGATIVQTYTFDFFNYAGIHRSVRLYTTPKVYIQDIKLETNLDSKHTGFIYYSISANSDAINEVGGSVSEPLTVHLQLRDQKDIVVASNHLSGKLFNGSITVPNAQAWWPYLMHPRPGYLYKLEVYLHAGNGQLLDIYRMKLGIRTLSWNNTTLLLNGKPLYLRGVGRHEDADVRGKGFDLPLLTRDFNLMKWIGANAYRTSHYPYSEESMQFADEEGIMIIDECSSVNTDNFEAALLLNHKSAIEQLIHRDRNHPSVIMWSIANEPRSGNSNATEYFKLLTDFTRKLDGTRPLTAAINVVITKDHLAQYLDIISFNRYNAWYQNSGRLDMITNSVINEAREWHSLYNKPIVMTEYGAGAMEGLHFLPTYIWSEDFQTELFIKHFKAFDQLRQQTWFIGEFVWNFADFKTEQSNTRVGGNKKGIFTRNRQPKTAAYVLRQRYYALALQLDEIIVPDDVFPYVIDWSNQQRRDYSDL